MIKITSKSEFMRIAYSFMRVFSKIEAVTVSYDSMTATIDFWKTGNVMKHRGIYYVGSPCNRPFSIGQRTNHKLICSIKVKDLTLGHDEDSFFVRRTDFLNPYKNQRNLTDITEIKNKFKPIAETANFKTIEIGSYSEFKFVNKNGEMCSVFMRGSGYNVRYRGSLNY